MQRTLTQNGLPVAVIGDSVQTATQIAGGAGIVTNSNSRDLWNVHAFNTTTDYVTLSVEIGNPHCTVKIIIPPSGNGAQTVLSNIPLPRNTSIRAYASRGNAVYLYGFAGSSVAAPAGGANSNNR